MSFNTPSYFLKQVKSMYVKKLLYIIHYSKTFENTTLVSLTDVFLLLKFKLRGNTNRLLVYYCSTIYAEYNEVK